VDATTASFKPQVRITGVFKGADVLTTLIDSGRYHLLPAVDVYLGIELGILNEAFMLDMRSQMPEAEFIRQFLCKNVAARTGYGRNMSAWPWPSALRRPIPG